MWEIVHTNETMHRKLIEHNKFVGELLMYYFLQIFEFVHFISFKLHVPFSNN